MTNAMKAKLAKPQMTAIISQLWDTGIDIISIEGDDTGIGDVSDLRKCKNVLVGDYDREARLWEVMIDNYIVRAHFATHRHPSGCGKLTVCEIYY